MQLATSTADRVVAVLSPDYLRSEHVEAEWRVFYARDPTGEQGLLLPVRVRDVDPSGLLKTRIYVDLVNRDAVSAQKALLTAARKTRGKPTDEPEFPVYGDRRLKKQTHPISREICRRLAKAACDWSRGEQLCVQMTPERSGLLPNNYLSRCDGMGFRIAISTPSRYLCARSSTTWPLMSAIRPSR